MQRRRFVSHSTPRGDAEAACRSERGADSAGGAVRSHLITDACVYLKRRQHESLLIPAGKLSCCSSSKGNGERLRAIKPIKTKQSNSKTQHKLLWGWRSLCTWQSRMGSALQLKHRYESFKRIQCFGLIEIICLMCFWIYDGSIQAGCKCPQATFESACLDYWAIIVFFYWLCFRLTFGLMLIYLPESMLQNNERKKKDTVERLLRQESNHLSHIVVDSRSAVVVDACVVIVRREMKPCFGPFPPSFLSTMTPSRRKFSRVDCHCICSAQLSENMPTLMWQSLRETRRHTNMMDRMDFWKKSVIEGLRTEEVAPTLTSTEATWLSFSAYMNKMYLI